MPANNFSKPTPDLPTTPVLAEQPSVAEPHPQPERQTPDAPVLEILYQDEWLVAINKPAGMLVHRSFLDKHETVFVLQTLRDQLGRHVFPLHRLDRPTSGVLLFALSADVARQMGERQHQWQKTYLALVRGHLQQALLLDYALKEQLDDIADKQARQHKAAQSAQTALWPLAHFVLPVPVGRYPEARYSLLALQPLTGRKHQLRRHCAHLLHPIVGDTTHGDGKHNQLFRRELACHRLLLHAAALEFQHPISAKLIRIEAPAADVLALLHAIGWQGDEAALWPQLKALRYKELPLRQDEPLP